MKNTEHIGQTQHRAETDFAERVRINQNKLAARIAKQYDYIVCGSGSSGSVVAGRLAANPEVQVLLLEAGGSDDLELVMDPNRWVAALGSELDWRFKAEPNPNLNGRAIPYSMGKVLGGGSSINVCTWSRGHKADWDYFATEANDPAWNYASVLEIYRRVEDWQGKPDPKYRGEKGPVYVQSAPDPHPFFQAKLEGAESLGIERFENANGRMMEANGGCSLVDEIVRNGRRQSIFRSYVFPHMAQSNLTVLTGALVTRLVFDGNRATGVEFSYNGDTLRIGATYEIVLSLGAIQTPKLLMQSGIGDESELAKFNIPLLQALPGVGQNLHDHVAFGCVWQSVDRPMPTVPRGQAVSFWKSHADLDAPEFYAYARVGTAISPENATVFTIPQATWSLSVGMRPASRGSIHLTGREATDPLRIDANYLADARDMKSLTEGIAMFRDLGNSAPLRPYTSGEVAPGNLGGAELERFIRNGLGTFWHQSCTAKMGTDSMSVVDGKLRVYGVDGLRIADASVMPRVTTGNTMAPSVIIGERAAAILQAEHQ